MISPHDPQIRSACEALANAQLSLLKTQAIELDQFELAGWLEERVPAARCLGEAAFELWRRVGSTELGSEEPFNRAEHYSIFLRTLADAAVRAVHGDGAKTQSTAYQVAVLRAAGVSDYETRAEVNPQLEQQMDSTHFTRVPTPAMRDTLARLEALTGVPWKYVSGPGNLEIGAVLSGEGAYHCRLEAEGAARALTGALNQVGRSRHIDGKVAYLCRAVSAEDEYALEVSVPADIAEDQHFAQALTASEGIRTLKRCLARLQYAKHYTEFQHQESAAREARAAGSQGPHYEDLVVEKTRVDRELLLSDELKRLTRLPTLPPDLLQRGYSLMFEHEATRDLAQAILCRVADQAGVSSGASPWTSKLHAYDRRFELHLPPSWVEEVEFRLILELNSEVREMLRAVAIEDRELMLDLEAAQEDFVSAVEQARQDHMEGRVLSAAKDVDTSLTQQLRIALVNSIVAINPTSLHISESVANQLTSASPRSLNEFLAAQSLPWLLQEESERLRRLEGLIADVSAECREKSIPVSPHCAQRAFTVSFDSRFCERAERYLDSMDRLVTGIVL